MATQRRGTKKATKAKTKAAKANAKRKTKASTASRKPVARAARTTKPKASPRKVAKRAKAAKAAKATRPAKAAKATRTAKAAKAAKPVARAKAKRPAQAAKPERKAAARAGGSSRRDAAGHLDAGYAKKLRALSRASRADEGTADAFVLGSRAPDDLAEELAEEAVATMTSGEYESAEVRDSEVPEETGGPFVPSTGAREFAPGTDLSNPTDAEREPFPRT